MEHKPQSKHIKTLFKYDTVYCADSVEWCPFNVNFFVCANYQIDENQKRFGRILLFSIDPIKGLNLHQTIKTSAVLDQKWCPNLVNNNIPVLGVVNAVKTLEIYSLNNDKLELITKTEISNDGDDETETLILSLDWSLEGDLIACSDSKGRVHVFKYQNNHLNLLKSWSKHSYEAWIVAFYYWDKNILFSGGDDCLFFMYDQRVDEGVVAKNKNHEAGVTAIHSNKKQEYIIATGSYDEKVRLWDIRNIKNPINSIKMPGTLWRLKWDPFIVQYLLSACMLGGVHVINTKSTNNKLEIIESYYEHKNISYGSDWCHLKNHQITPYNDNANAIIASCSFYDHLLCISSLKLDEL